jgi:hypothetical protein
MGTRKVINDLHYNGKTVNERLACDGLFDQFTAAVDAHDAARMIELLQQVSITRPRAEQLVAMLLEKPQPAPIHLTVDDPRNRGLKHKSNELRFPPLMLPGECPRDPYMNMGCHPETVERVWDQLGSVLPANCRSIVFGTPGLVAPRSGILLASAFGTAYILRLCRETMEDATRGGASTQRTWSRNHRTDLAQQYGDDWIFGGYLKHEPDWLLAVYRSIEEQVSQIPIKC